MTERAAAKPLSDLERIAHLYRRAGFGASRNELVAALAKGYEAVVEELVHPEAVAPLDDELIYRHCPDARMGLTIAGVQVRWLYRMINSPRPLEEKLTLFWHGLFATSISKVRPWQLGVQIDMLRRNCLADFRTILTELAKDPAMIFWLDNQENTNAVHNENFGRELLELFSMGLGNYTEDDVKACARAFTGWTVGGTYTRDVRLTAGAVSAILHPFEFRPDLHDDGEKTFLGKRGRFNGNDIIDIIVRHPATARFIARKLHNFFVSDQPDEAAVEYLAGVFTRTGGDIREVVRSLFLSDFFRAPEAYYAKVKSPVEHVVGILRLVGGFERPEVGAKDLGRAPGYMGQDLLNPPSVEGWHTGREWIDSGLLIERVNFAAEQLGRLDRPGLRRIIQALRERGALGPEQFVDACLDLIGPLQVGESTRTALTDFAAAGGPLRWEAQGAPASEQRVGELLQVIAASREFQFA